MSSDWRNSVQAEIRFQLAELQSSAYDNDDTDMDCAAFNTSTQQTPNIAECPICYETKDVYKLVKSCQHPSACYDCLRTLYVSTATSWSNYPLCCFDLNCRKIIREDNLSRLDLFWTHQERQRYRLLSILAKGYRQAGRTTVNCPHCEPPSIIQTTTTFHKDSQFTYRCLGCRNDFFVDTVLVRRDNVGPIYGLAFCPHCGMFVSKGRHCGKEFNWERGFECLWKARRNLVQYGIHLEETRKIRLATCKKAIRRLCKLAETLPAHEQFPCDQQTIDALLSQPVGTQEIWVRNAVQRIRLKQKQDTDGKTQRSLTEY